MRLFLTVLFYLLLSNNCFSQRKLIIAVSELRDYKNRNDSKQRLVNDWKFQEVVFTEKKRRDKFVCKRVESISLIKEYDRVKWTVISQDSSSKKYKKIFSKKEFDSAIAKIFKKDTSKKERSILHTSHHYLNLYVYIIEHADTIKLWKTKPFDSTTCWWVTDSKKDETLFQNLDFDLFIYKLLPKKFIARERLLALPRENEWDY